MHIHYVVEEYTDDTVKLVRIETSGALWWKKEERVVLYEGTVTNEALAEMFKHIRSHRPAELTRSRTFNRTGGTTWGY